MELSPQFKANVAKIINNEWLSDKETQMSMIHLETEMEILKHKIDQSIEDAKSHNRMIEDAFKAVS